ncbi:MAG: DMT family transporter [Rhizobiaceae bacterium]|nr:DMT family transporter [Rhizobiaceae bacterium]
MTRIQRATIPDLILVALTALVWASGFIAIKVAVPETNAYWLAAMRVTTGLLVLLPYALWKGILLPNSKRMWILVLGMSLVNVVLPFILISWAELSIDAGVTALLMGTGPFLALIGSHIFTTDDKLTGTKFLGVVLGFTGVLTIVGFDVLYGLGRANLMAQAACFLGSVCYATAGLLVRKIELPPGRLAFLALALSTVLLIPIAFFHDGPPPTDISQNAVLAIIYLGVFPTGFAYLLRFHLIRKIGYSTFAMGLNLIPVFGVFLGVWLLDEPLSWRILAALIFVVCGLYIAQIKRGESLTEPDTNE